MTKPLRSFNETERHKVALRRLRPNSGRGLGYLAAVDYVKARNLEDTIEVNDTLVIEDTSTEPAEG